MLAQECEPQLIKACLLTLFCLNGSIQFFGALLEPKQ